MNEYDISASFEAIEQELIASMIRNMNRHRAEELKEGYDWSMWQVEQLKALEKYKLENQKKYSKQFKSINAQIGELIWQARQQGGMKQEAQILRAIKNGFKSYKPASAATQAEFFKLNTRKLEALIKATSNDMKKAETAVLRMANDQYRKAIFTAQVYANSGAGTYEKAVDMATKDMLSRGLNCVEYKNGARHALSDYADMAIRTASKRAYLQGEGEKRQEWGISTVIVNKRGNPCPKCLPFVGKVLIDDVWSGGKASDGPYPLMSAAIARGLYHPRCKDSHSTYFPGISTAEDTWTKRELRGIDQKYKQEQNHQYNKRQADKYGQLSQYSLDKEDKEKYKNKADEWSKASQADIIQEGAFKNLVIDQLPTMDSINSTQDRKVFAEHLIDRLGIERNNIPVKLRKMDARGGCSYYPKADKGICEYIEYALQSDDERSMPYQIKTAFHESYHLSLHGRKWDAVKNGRPSEKWRIMEETFAEVAAHHAAALYGIEEKLAPAYGDILAKTLPRLKRLPKFKNCNTAMDFGKIAWRDRLLGNSGVWEQLYDDTFSLRFDERSYYKQYYKSIELNKKELLNKFFENNPKLRQYEDMMGEDLKNALSKVDHGISLDNLSTNERVIFSNVIVNAMWKEGIK
ncbi:phage minor capsid protein [Lacrimispora amygdalina]|uniref:phage minor capsid protein n=1 Tax=Lacrimispora amygdalina TaxID=253257 RepID=UPI000BE335F7|nr:phage minor capsid protein [Lacrimispora amygdalina]